MFFNRVKTFILLATMSMFLLLVGRFFGGNQGLQIALIIALVINVGAYFYSDKIVLKMYGAKPLNRSRYGYVYDMVEELTSVMKIPMPKLWIVHSSMANAFATGRNPSHASVAVTDGILDLLDKNEIRGVLAHELSHIKNRDILIATIAATIATTISYMASMLRFTAIWGAMGGGNRRRGGNPFVMIFVAILMPIAAALIQMAISRSREYMADEAGAYYSNDPLSLASALEKLHFASQHKYSRVNSAGKESTASLFIVHPFSGDGMLSLFSTHPPIGKRIERLRRIYEKMFQI